MYSGGYLCPTGIANMYHGWERYLPVAGAKDTIGPPSQLLESGIPLESIPRSACGMLLESTPRRSGIGSESSRVNASIGCRMLLESTPRRSGIGSESSRVSTSRIGVSPRRFSDGLYTRRASTSRPGSACGVLVCAIAVNSAPLGVFAYSGGLSATLFYL